MHQFSFNAGISATSITYSMPPGQFFTVEPGVQVTIFGAPTEVDIAFRWEAIAGAGEVITGVTLTFKVAVVGKRFSLLLIGE